MLDTLEMELAEMEEKRQNIDAENNKLKTSIAQHQQRNREAIMLEQKSPSKQSMWSKSNRYFGDRKEKTLGRRTERLEQEYATKCCGCC